MVPAVALLIIYDCDPHGESLPRSVFKLHILTVEVGSVVAECKTLVSTQSNALALSLLSFSQHMRKTPAFSQ